MVEVPGMTRRALDAMTPPDVMKLRWAVYARALEPIVRFDFDDAIRDVNDAESPPSKSALKARHAVRREDLTQGKIEQAKIRARLGLDDEGDDEPA
jgi:hypothetical protein